MATVTGFTAERMLEMEDATIISGEVVGDDLILETKDGTPINAGNVRGPIGPSGGAFIQCTNATQPALTAPDAGKAIYETDTKLWRIWTGTLYRVQEKFVCTSVTRPTTYLSTDAGAQIFETDTGMDYFWTGSGWFPAGSYVAKFANAAARTAAWPSPGVGALSYLTDSPGILWVYESGVWNSSGDPPGSYFPWIGTTAPLCHVLMYGQTLTNAQTLYPILWANAASTWKSGSSLIVPDMRGRSPFGLDNMGGSDAGRLSVANTLGGTGGAQTVALTEAELAVHDHGLGSVGAISSGGVPGIALTGTSGAAGATENAGSGNAHQNMPPYILMNWALKVL